MEARIAEFAEGTGHLLLSPGLIGAFAVGLLSVFTGAAGRLVLLVEDRVVAPRVGPKRLDAGADLPDAARPPVVRDAVTEHGTVVVLPEDASAEAVLGNLRRQGDLPRRVSFRPPHTG